MPEGSQIIRISTTQCTTTTATPLYLLDNASNSALKQMARAMCKELAPRGICVNALVLGPVGTDLFLVWTSER